jgi:hypothetical protein
MMTIPEIGDNLTLLSALIATLLPGMIARINHRGWSSETKGAAAAAVCVGVGASVAGVAGYWDGGDIVRSVLTVFFLSQIAYKLYWQPSGLAERIERN